MTESNKKTVEDYFSEYKKHLSKIGKLTSEYSIDEVALRKLSEWEKLYQDMREICENPEFGYTQKTQSGYSQIRAEYTIMVKAQDFILSLGQKFGLTPADRDKILKGKSAPKSEKKGFDLGSKPMRVA